MADKGGFDPMAAWSQFVTTWEQQVNEFSAKISSSKEFGGTMNQASNVSRVVQRSFADQMEKVLKALNLPTQGQVGDVGDRLLAVEEKLDRLAIAVAEANHRQTQAETPPVRRTRQPPAPADAEPPVKERP